MLRRRQQDPMAVLIEVVTTGESFLAAQSYIAQARLTPRTH